MIACVSFIGLLNGVPAQVSVTTYHNDTFRTGLNSSETILTPANVNSKSFGLLFSLPVDGQVYAQPLYLSQVSIPGKGKHNVIYIATEHNSVYAFDADSNAGVDSQPLWHVNFGPTVPAPLTYSALVSPEVGITSTPVIVSGPSPILYVVSSTYSVNAKGTQLFAHALHALDATTGLEKLGGPIQIKATILGNGSGSLGGHLTFADQWQHNRAALLFVPSSTTGSIHSGSHITVPGTVYVPFGSYGDPGPYHGWLFAYDAATLTQVSVFCTGPNARNDPSGYPLAGAGIWGGGCGPCSDGKYRKRLVRSCPRLIRRHYPAAQ